MKKSFTRLLLKRLFSNLYFLFFANGFLIALVMYTYTEDQYEGQLFSSLRSDVYQQLHSNSPSDEVVLLQSTHVVHALEASRQQFFSNKEIDGFKGSFLQPLSYDLMTAHGACGSYSYILGRLVMSMNFDVRFVQMKVGDIYGGHNIVEIKLKDRWVAFDPLYDLHFTKPNGQLAGFAEVHANWNYYKSQVPAGYDMSYNYADARYTNWNKIPVLMPAVKKVLDLTMGKERADTISLRGLFLRKFRILWISLLTFYGLLFLYTTRRFLVVRKARINIRPAGNDGFGISHTSQTYMAS